MADRISTLVVEADRSRARLAVDGLWAVGDLALDVIPEQAPDVVPIDVADPSRDAPEELALASGSLERPVAMSVDRSDHGLTRTAIEAGMPAHVVAGLQPPRIEPILDAAVARFQLFQRMRAELEAAKNALEERGAIDRAKGLLMKARSIGEEEARTLLRRAAMDGGQRVGEVAQALVTAARLLSRARSSFGWALTRSWTRRPSSSRVSWVSRRRGGSRSVERAPSWSALRDALVLGRVEAAHTPAPVPVARALALGGMAAPLDAVSALPIDGTVIGVSRALAARLREAGHRFGLDDALAAGRALLAADTALRIGVPFPFSMRAEPLHRRLGPLVPGGGARSTCAPCRGR